MADTPLTNLDTVTSTDRTAAGSQPDFSTPTGTIVSGTTGNGVVSVTATSPLSSSGGTSPNIAISNQAINKVLAGPISGSSAAPTFRLLDAADIPASLNATTINGIYNTGLLQQTRVGYSTGGNIQIRFDLGAFADIGLTVNASFSPSGSGGIADGRTQELVLRNTTGGALTLTWNASWVIAGPALPTSLAAGAAIRVFLTCNGTAESNVVATYVPASTGGGTVTSVAVTSANGVSGTVANSTTAANITLTLGDISAATSKPSGTGTTTRTFAARNADVYNVKDFGAVGNSTTDDTSAIQAATNAAAAVNGCVYLPSGNYKITSAITLPQPFYGVVSFKGDGSRQSTLIQATGAANGIYADLSKTIPATSMSAGYTYCIVSIGSTDFTTIGAASNTVGLSFLCTGTGSGSGTGSDIILKRKNAVNIYNLGFTCANGINPGIAVYLDYGPGTISTEVITGCVVEDVYVGQYTDAGNSYTGGWTSALVMRNAWHFRVHGLNAIGYSGLSTGFTGPGSGYAIRLKGGVNGSIMSVQANYWSYGIVIEPDVPNTDPDPQGITVSDIITVEVDNPIVTRKTGYTTGAIDVEFSSMLIDNGNSSHANPAVQLQACSAGTIITNTFILLVGATSIVELAYCEDCVIQGVEIYGPVTNGVHLKDGTKNTLISNNSFRGQTNPVNIESNCYGNRVIENIVASPGDAGGMQSNRVYVITSAGSTSFTSYGAPSNSAGTIFIATGAGTGTGTVDDMTFTATNSGGASNVIKGSFTGCGALVQKASDTSISSGSSVHIPFGTTIFDDVGFVDSGNYKLKIPNGVYAVRLSANVTWENNSSSYRFVSIRKNNSSIVASQLQVANLNSQINISSPVLKVTAGDYFEFFAEQGTGSGLVVSASEQTWFSIEVIK